MVEKIKIVIQIYVQLLVKMYGYEFMIFDIIDDNKYTVIPKDENKIFNFVLI